MTVYWADGNEYATISVTFTGTPSSVVLTVTDPNGATSTPAMTGSGAGPYTANVASPVAGIWSYLVEGTGTASDAVAGTWTVTSAALNRYYCSAEELKARLRITTSSDDDQINLAVAGATLGINGYCERYFWRGSDVRTYVPDDLYRCKTDDLVSVTTLGTDPGGTTAQGGTFPVTWAASDFQLLPYNPGKTGEPWPYTSVRAVGHFTFPWVTPLVLMRMDRVQVTGVFGWPAVPQAIRSASLIAAAELFRMKDMPVGGEVPGEFAVAMVSSNPMIGKLIAPYARNPVLVA